MLWAGRDSAPPRKKIVSARASRLTRRRHKAANSPFGEITARWFHASSSSSAVAFARRHIRPACARLLSGDDSVGGGQSAPGRALPAIGWSGRKTRFRRPRAAKRRSSFTITFSKTPALSSSGSPADARFRLPAVRFCCFARLCLDSRPRGIFFSRSRDHPYF